jgi:hypothetical protein
MFDVLDNFSKASSAGQTAYPTAKINLLNFDKQHRFSEI